MSEIRDANLSKEEINVLKKMDDHRCVSLALENAFCDGGLSSFKNFINHFNDKAKKHEKIAVLLRGNNNSIIVYKNNHKDWELSASKDKCTVKFDFNHARYTSGWEEVLETLTKSQEDGGLGFCLPKRKKETELLPSDKKIKITRNKKHEVIGGEIGVLCCSRESFDMAFVEENYSIIAGLIDDFFSREKTTDFFKKAVKDDPQYRHLLKNDGGKRVEDLIEKRWQQRLLFEFDNMQDGYYAYDLEFAQKYPDKNFVEKCAKKYGKPYQYVNAKDLKEKLVVNEPDMLAVKYDKNGDPNALVFIEIKSKWSACEGASDIPTHMSGMKKYTEQRIFMKNRIEDCNRSLKQLKEMEIINKDVNLKIIDDDIPIERLLILTNCNNPEAEPSKESALEYFETHMVKIKEWANDNECDVWITKSNYWEDTIEFQRIDVNKDK